MGSLLKVVRALNLREDRRSELLTIDPRAWTGLLRLTDEARLTLPLAERCREYLPPAVRERVVSDLERNRIRLKRGAAAYREIESEFRKAGIEFIVLKGVTHWPLHTADSAQRPQYDLDLYCAPAAASGAAEAIRTMSYEPVRAVRGPQTDHLPAMVRKTEWCWRGDYYDPDLPFSVEIHHRFWNPDREYFDAGAGEGFWERRTLQETAFGVIPALDPAHVVSYAAGHIVRHLVRGDLRLYHVYELACFLHASARDNAFWSVWSGAGLVAESIAFRLARDWFDCDLHPVAKGRIACLSAGAQRWFGIFGQSPINCAERANKDEMFLHLAIADRWKHRFGILGQRLVPMNPPHVSLDPHAPGARAAQASFLLGRARHHLLAAGPVVRSAWRWWMA